MNKTIHLRNPQNGECHAVTIYSDDPQVIDAVLDQFNLSRMEFISADKYEPAEKTMTLDLCDPRDSSLIIGNMETTFIG